MISFPIIALRATGLFDEIIVSTDDDEITEVSLLSGADQVLRRPKKLAENQTPTVEVIANALEELELSLMTQICVAYATNPLLNSAAIKVAYGCHLDNPKANYTTTLAKYGFPPQRSLVKNDSNLFAMNDPSQMYTNSQDLAPIFHETGQFWWGKVDKWVMRVGMQLNLGGIVLPDWMTQDIDDEDDWIVAEAKYDNLINNPKLIWGEQDILDYNLKYGIKINL